MSNTPCYQEIHSSENAFGITNLNYHMQLNHNDFQCMLIIPTYPIAENV